MIIGLLIRPYDSLTSKHGLWSNCNGVLRHATYEFGGVAVPQPSKVGNLDNGKTHAEFVT